MQSHAGEIAILPAVSPKWKNGSVRGLKARGGFEVGAAWKDGKLASADLVSQLGNPAVLRLQGDPKEITLKEKDGRTATISADKDGLFHFPTKAGTTYQIQP